MDHRPRAQLAARRRASKPSGAPPRMIRSPVMGPSSQCRIETLMFCQAPKRRDEDRHHSDHLGHPVQRQRCGAAPPLRSARHARGHAHRHALPDTSVSGQVRNSIACANSIVVMKASMASVSAEASSATPITPRDAVDHQQKRFELIRTSVLQILCRLPPLPPRPLDQIIGHAQHPMADEDHRTARRSRTRGSRRTACRSPRKPYRTIAPCVSPVPAAMPRAAFLP
jgi:hypothetical protein